MLKALAVIGTPFRRAPDITLLHLSMRPAGRRLQCRHDSATAPHSFQPTCRARRIRLRAALLCSGPLSSAATRTPSRCAPTPIANEGLRRNIRAGYLTQSCSWYHGIASHLSFALSGAAGLRRSLLRNPLSHVPRLKKSSSGLSGRPNIVRPRGGPE